MTTTVINLHTWRVPLVDGEDVYVGRRAWSRRLAGSVFANPYRLDPKRPREEQGEVLEQYRAWLRSHPELIDLARRELRGKRLACWCAPHACHADILARVADGGEP